jgi:hypothetical protein
MEIFSNKSERNIYKNKNISYKSVSEISEFEEYNEEEPPSNFVLNKKKAPKSQSQHSKLNESSHSDVVSNYSVKDFEEKDEDKN